MHLIGKLSYNIPFGSQVEQQKEEGLVSSKVSSKKRGRLAFLLLQLGPTQAVLI